MQPSKNKKILVTGAGGFIGSHLVEELVHDGYAVRALVHYNSMNSWGWLETLDKNLLNEVEVVLGDVRDPFGMENFMKDCSAVLHLAALIGIPYSYHSPASYVETNIQGTLNVLQAARKLNVERVVQTSTSETYGTAQFVPINETHPLQGQSPYSATKIGADHLALSFALSFDTPVSIIRPFNTYGPRQSARAIIPSIITQALLGKQKIKIGSLHPTRDFTYVKDTARGFIDVGLKSNLVGEIVNLSSNFEISIGDLVKLTASLTEKQIEVEVDDQRIRPQKSEVERLWGDNSKALENSPWRPRYIGNEGFKKGLQETIKWFQDSKNLSLYKSELYNL